MKKLLPFFLLALVSFRSPDATITADERKAALEQLKLSRDQFTKATEGLTEAQMNYKATPDSWSVAEVAEHIAVSESAIWSMLEGAMKQPADPSRRGEVKVDDAGILAGVSSRERKVKTSEALTPANKFGSADGSIREFMTKRDSHIAFVKDTQEDLRNRYAQTPFGIVDAYQVILFMSGHTTRHVKQMEEVMANASFPKK